MGTSDTKPSMESIVLFLGKTLYSIPYEKIEFIETGNKRCTLHFVDETESPLTVRSQDVEKQLLSRPEFIRTHRGYIANLDRMRTIENKKLVSVTNKLIPVASNFEAKVKANLVERLYRAVRQ